MKILTVIRQAPDAEESVRLAAGKVDLAGSKLVMDAMDEYGVEEALRLREAGSEVEVIVLAVGPARAEDVLRSALAMGADRAIHVETDLLLDPIAFSAVVAKLAKAECVELILTGGQQSDWDSQALGAATAERLRWPQATWTSALKLDGSTLVGRHDVDAGAEEFELALPAVITTQQGLNEPRYPTLPNIMKARKKELRKESLDSFGIVPKLVVTDAEIQVKERLRKMIDAKDVNAAAAELVNALRNEARVIA